MRVSSFTQPPLARRLLAELLENSTATVLVALIFTLARSDDVVIPHHFDATAAPASTTGRSR